MIRIWNVRSGEDVHTLAWKKERLDHVAVSPDGLSALVGSSTDGAIRLWDFSRPERYRRFEPLMEEAQRRLTKDGGDAEALKTLGEYYAFRDINDWAADLLERARKGGAQISPPTLARCYWKLSEGNAVGEADKKRCRSLAAAEFQKEIDRVKNLPPSASSGARLNREQESMSLNLCLRAVQAPPL